MLGSTEQNKSPVGNREKNQVIVSASALSITEIPALADERKRGKQKMF